jgi:hypothetical protein
VRRVALAGFVLLLAPAAAGVPFEPDLPFANLARDDSVAVLSGALELDSVMGASPAVLANVTGFTIDGLDVVCWEYPCYKSDGPLSVRVVAGSTVALRYPLSGSLRLEADHAVAAPVLLDASQAGFSNLDAGFTLAPSLAAATTGGLLRFLPETLAAQPDGPVPAQPPVTGLPELLASQFQAPDPTDADGALLAGLTPGSRIELLDQGRTVRTLDGSSGLLLQGTIAVDPVEAEAYVVPCGGRCDMVFRPGHDVDVLGAVERLLGLTELVQGEAVPALELGPWGSLVNPVANGAYVDLPLITDPGDFDVGSLTLVRFDRLEASLYPGAPPGEGTGALVIQSGNVQGSPEFLGVRYFSMPLLSYILWGLALLAVLARWVFARQEPKHRSGLARTLAVVCFVVLLAVWHLTFERTLGLGAFSPGLEASTRGLVAGVELATFLAMLLLVVVPVRLFLGHGLRTVRLRKASAYAGTLALVAGGLLGPLILLGILDFALGLF